jgi:exonuclease SbcC
MLKRIELTNFMSHKHTVIDLAPGLTVLVGPNNCGKSAVVAALQILSENANSTYVRRHGEKDCSVRVETDDGHVVEWHRKSTPYYVIDDRLFDRLKDGMPEAELNQILRLPSVKVGTEDCNIHFGAQKSPIFLLDRSGAHAASFFASSSDAVCLVEMQARHRKRASEAQQRKKHLDNESRQLNAEIDALAPAVELERHVDRIEEQYRELGEIALALQAIARAAAGLRHQSDAVDCCAMQTGALAALVEPPALTLTEPLEEHRRNLVEATEKSEWALAVEQALAALSAPPELANVEPLAGLIGKLARENRTAAWRDREQAVLAPLRVPPPFRDISMLATLIDQLRAADGAHAAADGRVQELSRLAPPPELARTAELHALLASMRDACRRAAHWQCVTEAVTALTSAPAPADTAALRQLAEDMARATEALARAARQAQQADAELADARADLQAFADASPVCPTCGAVVEADRLMAHAAADHGGQVPNVTDPGRNAANVPHTGGTHA